MAELRISELGRAAMHHIEEDVWLPHTIESEGTLDLGGVIRVAV